ncbi:hypothetical protein SAMN04487884_112130 [Butyrivibrio fibrisolvens]|uniref:Uncharacterized protein n=1 Tax=Butyrivibrio fibrisolvens TaxID=831 RepID=A0A1H9SP93_BUTFI|nr:hypothetical protein [Butyrivibrio fibrisolvens]SER86751.1 hypothetical protein SAMN04487884_112130 [Butyrivibrio fibrisolvens]
MKTDIIKLSSDISSWEDALDETEKCGRYNNLGDTQVLKLRLLGEELMNLMKSIVGEFDGSYWIETKNNKFEVHVTADTQVSFLQRESLLDASKTSEEEQKKKGFFKTIINVWKDYVETQSVILNDPIMQQRIEIMGLGIDSGELALKSWSLNRYVETLPDDQKDDLEQFIVKSLADDILVSAKKDHASLIAVRTF